MGNGFGNISPYLTLVLGFLLILPESSSSDFLLRPFVGPGVPSGVIRDALLTMITCPSVEWSAYGANAGDARDTRDEGKDG